MFTDRICQLSSLSVQGKIQCELGRPQPFGNHVSNVLEHRESHESAETGSQWDHRASGLGQEHDGKGGRSSSKTRRKGRWCCNKVSKSLQIMHEERSNSILSGNPHSTGEDRYHVSGALSKKTPRGQNRLASFLVYPDGTVTFAKKKFPTVEDSIAEAEASCSTQPGAQMPAHQQAPDWEWDRCAQKYKYWNGCKWVWQG